MLPVRLLAAQGRQVDQAGEQSLSTKFATKLATKISDHIHNPFTGGDSDYDYDHGAPSEARRFLQGESPCRVRTSHPLVPSVGTVEEESHPNDIV